ncbi:hypothetical protein [Mycobacterium lepromatosis]
MSEYRFPVLLSSNRWCVTALHWMQI